MGASAGLSKEWFEQLNDQAKGSEYSMIERSASSPNEFSGLAMGLPKNSGFFCMFQYFGVFYLGSPGLDYGNFGVQYSELYTRKLNVFGRKLVKVCQRLSCKSYASLDR